jgi:glycosyltransferase involved in cell wall biosynthesis
MQAGRPFLAWLGTPFMPDREVRIRQFPLPRRLLDMFVNTPVCLHYERRVLNSGAILPTTRYVYSEFRRLAPRGDIRSPIPIPIDTCWFSPPPACPTNCDITFVGKYNDPRKNIFLLIDVVRLCRESGLPAVLNLYGAEPSGAVRNYIRKTRTESWVRGLSTISAADLLELYRSTAVFVIPSHQEGFCVAGIEAMACGCPVVTTACGGPEDYVTDGQNGYVTPVHACAVADRVIQILRSPEERQKLALAARATAVAGFSASMIEERFMDTFRNVFAGH